MPRVYITGGDGTLGTALQACLAADMTRKDWVVCAVSADDFDIRDTDATLRSVEDFAPDVVLHLAAIAILDDCESHPDRAVAVNVGGTANVVRACRAVGARLLYVSSDYVFDGLDTPAGGYTEGDVPAPVSVYGATKLAAEHIVQLVEQHLIVRTAWLYGGVPPAVDQVAEILDAAISGCTVSAIADQFGSPTYVSDLANVLLQLITSTTTGTLNVAGPGRAAWFDVARVVADEVELATAAAVHCQPILLDDAGFIAQRPVDSTLNCERAEALGYGLPSWSDSVRRLVNTQARCTL